MITIALLDYEMSNLRSAAKALERVGARVRLARGPGDGADADALVLPGVGHFGEAMRRIRAQGLDELVYAARERERPLLGICLGMQLLFESSEESPGTAGLGLLAGRVERLRTERKLPQIGWNRVSWAPGAPLAPATGTGLDSTYYFVHEFACRPVDPAIVWGRASYGEEFCAVAGAGGVAGVQFHPEKSSRAGLLLLGAWVATVAAAPTAA